MLQHHVSRRDSDDMARKHTVQMQPTGSNLLAESEWFRSDELFRELVPGSSRVYQKISSAALWTWHEPQRTGEQSAPTEHSQTGICPPEDGDE